MNLSEAIKVLDGMFPVHTSHSSEYVKLILTNLENPPESTFTEKHHFLPRYDGGDEEVVTLEFRDHIKAHLLLALHYMEIGDKKRTRNNAAAVNACKKNSPVRNKKLRELTEEDKEELFRYYEEVSRDVSKCYSGENNAFYGMEHSPENIEKMLRSKGLSYDGVNTKPLERTEDSIKLRDYYIGVVRNLKFGTNRIIEVVRNDNNRLAAIPFGDFNDLEFSFIPWEMRFEKVNNSGIGSGRPGESKSDDHREKLRQFSLSEAGRERTNRINKDPEKIRKTAEKHRGMKRSKETCKRISEALKGKKCHNKGSVTYYHPDSLHTIYRKSDEEIPDGYIKGNPNTMSVTYYHSDTHETRIFRLKNLPGDDWIVGEPPIGPSPSQVRDLEYIRDFNKFSEILDGYNGECILLLYDTIFSNIETQVVATTNAIGFTDELRKMILELDIPEAHIKESTRKIISFYNGSRILIKTASPKSYSNIHIDKLFGYGVSEKRMDTLLNHLSDSVGEYTRI